MNLNERILQSPHVIISSATGCGKSVLLHEVICSVLNQDTAEGELYLIDLKRGIEFFEYSKLPHVSRFAMDAKTALEALDEAIRVMETRLDHMRFAGLKMYPGRHLWVVIDEMGFLLQNAYKQALPKLTLISQQGRAAKVHLICATQNPKRSGKAGIPAEVQQNFTLKIALHCSTAIESRQIIGVAGAEDLPKHGTALVWEDGYISRESIPMITDEEKAAAIANSENQKIMHMRQA